MNTKTAGEIMTREVKTLSPETTLREAAALLAEYNISGAPVVDSTGHVIGMLSESDLISEAKKQAAIPRIAPFGLFLVPMESLEHIYKEGERLIVEEIMRKKVYTALETEKITVLGDQMFKNKVNRVPIIDEDGKLVGIVSRADIMRAIFHLEQP
jgi:CBS domain-containing protein